jgi:hypothetical protein
LFLWQVFVLDESLVVVLAQLFAEEVLYNADVVGESVDADRVVGWRRGEQDAVRGNRALVLRLVAAVESVLEKVQRDAETFEPKLVCQTEFAKAEEVLLDVFGKVTTNELFAAIVESTDAVCACVVAKGRSLLHVSENVRVSQ